MRIKDMDLENYSIQDFKWVDGKRKITWGAEIKTWYLRYKETRRDLGTLQKSTDRDVYLGRVTVERLSGDFKFEESDFEVAKFKVLIKVVEKLKELQLDPERSFYEIY